MHIQYMGVHVAAKESIINNYVEQENHLKERMVIIIGMHYADNYGNKKFPLDQSRVHNLSLHNIIQSNNCA